MNSTGNKAMQLDGENLKVLKEQKIDVLTDQLPSDFNRLPNNNQIEIAFEPGIELKNSWIDPDKEIPAPPTILEIDEIPVFTAGNISTIIGKAKSKKTFLLTGILSAIASGAWGSLQGKINKTVLWFDTEMSDYHVSLMLQRCNKLMNEPGNLIAYRLRPYTPAQRVQIIEYAIENTENLGFVAIDGLRDLLSKGINDEEEATTITSKLMKWTTDKSIHISVVLHQNKGDNNARGHIGTEVLNKSETVISATINTQNKNVTIVEPTVSRNRPFNKFAFEVDITGLPVFTDMPANNNSQAISKGKPELNEDKIHFELIQKLFSNDKTFQYTELIEALKNTIPVGENNAKKFFQYFKDNNWIYKQGKTNKYHSNLDPD